MAGNQADEAYADRPDKGDRIAPFDPGNIPVQHKDEGDDAYHVRYLSFWRKYPQQAPHHVKQELAEESAMFLDRVDRGEGSLQTAEGFGTLAQGIVHYASGVVKRVLEGKEDPGPIFRSILKCVLDDISKMRIERQKTQGTLRVEAQRFRNEMEILSRAQGQITIGDRITIDFNGLNSVPAIETTATALDSVEEIVEDVTDAEFEVKKPAKQE